MDPVLLTQQNVLHPHSPGPSAVHQPMNFLKITTLLNAIPSAGVHIRHRLYPTLTPLFAPTPSFLYVRFCGGSTQVRYLGSSVGEGGRAY